MTLYIKVAEVREGECVGCAIGEADTFDQAMCHRLNGISNCQVEAHIWIEDTPEAKARYMEDLLRNHT